MRWDRRVDSTVHTSVQVLIESVLGQAGNRYCTVLGRHDTVQCLAGRHNVVLLENRVTSISLVCLVTSQCHCTIIMMKMPRCRCV